MPRNPQTVARQKLDAALANYSRATRAVSVARLNLREAMIAAVEAGVTRYEVASITGFSQAHVGQIDGMPKGKNARKVEETPSE